MDVSLVAANKQKTAVKLEKPVCVPAAPFFLTNSVLTIECQLSQLREAVERSLKESNVDYEYNDAKWKVNWWFGKRWADMHT
jgi:hypothetical protein